MFKLKVLILVILLCQIQKTLISSSYSVITIPKCGTHLLEKCINLINNYKWNPPILNDPLLNFTSSFIARKEDLITEILEQEYEYVYGHLPYTPLMSDVLFKKYDKLIFLIRDPRDQLLSFINFNGKTEIFSDIKNFNNILSSLITGSKKTVFISSIRNHQKNYANFIWNFGLAEFYYLFVPWIDQKNCYTIHFESLVGENGGGSLESQLEAINSIANAIGRKISNERAKQIACELFGGTFTFRKGQIGAWKHEFTPEHKELFKQYGGELLIKLGYEKDLNW